MKRFFSDFNGRRSRGEAAGDLREFAGKMRATGRARLRLRPELARSLRADLGRAARQNRPGVYADDALRRLNGDARRIEACLCQAEAESGARLPAARGEVRILALARRVVAGGESAPTRERLLRAIAEFDAARPLEMVELQRMPGALHIALCEALKLAARDVLHCADARARAERWADRGGRLRGSGCGAVFLEHALRLADERERPELQERLSKLLADQGEHPEWAVERAHRIVADCCLRLENLMQWKYLLDALDWRRCFEKLSVADAELREDPANVYENMDGRSREFVRARVAEMARRMGMEERTLVRCGLQAALDVLREHGGDDVRAGVCYYFATDAGAQVLMDRAGVRARLRRCVPDATGRASVAVVVGCALAAMALCMLAIGRTVLLPYALLLNWVPAMQLLSRAFPRFLRPGTILKMKLKAVPDSARTLVALPVLLSSADRAREMIAHMEALGCMEPDGNIDFLLLGDFRDAEAAHLEDDDAILAAAREGVARLNGAAGREKYFYLHRERGLREVDGRWMGENRKRGALKALNHLILDRPEADAAFGAEHGAARRIAGRGYRYVVTLDADTEYLPGTLLKLIGAMLHPLNRAEAGGYGVLQPDMQMTVDSDVNAYVELTAGCGGVDGYPHSVSNFYQDMTGRSNFAGKGIYDVRAFVEATEDVLPDDAILSHDLIEGILCGAGFVNDVSFYDGVPANPAAMLRREHRWVRGDWQLLPVLFSKLKIPAVDRMKMAGNLLRSLYAPALLGLLIHSLWLDEPRGFLLGLALAYLEALLCPLHGDSWRRATLKLALLPAQVKSMLDAVLRTLYRLAFSHRHLMDWVPAADASGSGKRELRTPGRIAAILLLPGLLRPFWVPAVLALAALFLVGPGWAEDLVAEESDARGKLSPSQAALLGDLARETWAFFENYVPLDGPGLPPDNVQVDPPAGAAARTSPTNIGLYLMSCVAAQTLGLVPRVEMLGRMAATVCTLERLEKWNGQLYNWYDLNDFAPLRPRYVSAVDSGNLAGALLLCAQEVRGDAAGLAGRMCALAEGMNLAALYDGERKLFRIGADVESGRLSQSHYDLYASESRILSYAAIMLGQVPAGHWRRLSRPAVPTGRGAALLSWSGTMFEYLMPELLLRSHDKSLAGESRREAVESQMRFARRRGRPWGVSESGYYAFDLQLNYQYRAFGLRELALDGAAVQDVVAPYATALALCCAPGAAADNLGRMSELGWRGEYGMYEAADYLHADVNGEPRLIRSYMAHHQGMALCALCNALRGDVLAKRFMEIPQARALRLLLQERRPERPRLRRGAEAVQSPRGPERAAQSFARSARPERYLVDAHLLHGGDTTALVTANGAAFAWHGGLQLNRFSGDLLNRHEGMYVHLRDAQTGATGLFGWGGRAEYGAGSARYCCSFSGVQAELRIAVSPETGALIQRLQLENRGDAARDLELTGCLAVALAPDRDMRAHPVFQNLFIESERIGPAALAFHRRSREPGAQPPQLIYLAAGAPEAACETELDRLVGRSGSLGEPGGIAGQLSGTCGSVLNPCAALRVALRLESGEKRSLHFALAAVDAQKRDALVRSLSAPSAADRALQLAEARARAALGFAGVDAQMHRTLQRCAALLFDARLRAGLNECFEACPAAERRLLWSAGISGDLPVLLAEVRDPERMDGVRELIRAHGFYRMMGVQTDLVLVSGQLSDYRQPVRSALEDRVRASHLCGLRGVPGGVFLLDRQNLDAATWRALERVAAISLAEDGQLRDALRALERREGADYASMTPTAIEMPRNLRQFNGYGGFDGEGYAICLRRDRMTPAPWSNVIASERVGAVLTERGGGFAWHGNSRNGRITPFLNDVLREGWGWMFYLIDQKERRYLRLLPGDRPMTDFIVRHAPDVSSFATEAEGLSLRLEARCRGDEILFEAEVENRSGRAREWRLAALVDWLMGTDATDACMLRTWSRFGACFASGVSGVGYFVADDLHAGPGCGKLEFYAGGDMMSPRGMDALERAHGGWLLQLPLRLHPGERARRRFALGAAADVASAYARVRELKARWPEPAAREELKLKFDTPDERINLLANGFLQAQTRNARVFGRTGLYQPGGAFGFRDQLQDMLPLIHEDPGRVRRHLLYCAARQFPAGDVLHWWHEPCTGVRTGIRDDLLFLPYVTARYVEITGDASVLEDSAPFLREVEIPEGKEDIYAEMQPSTECASLHEHCMRAFRRVAEFGAHGLCLMGGGDWNDGMNRVGAQGRGESVWLSEFLAVCAADYARIAPDGGDRAWLTALNERMCAAVEAQGWDGEWYLRAYMDDGRAIGGKNSACCRIDAISQAWAVLAGLDAERCRQAMDAAWRELADEALGAIRLLTPPFDGAQLDPGYIAAYPPGIRENGAQYTHGACWLALALVRMGDAERAHRAIQMLLPVNHSRDAEAAERYRVEPYVMTADICTDALHAGRGGWSWYTGSAAWMLTLLAELLGYERRGKRVRVAALLGEWSEAGVVVRFGSSIYRLKSALAAREVTLDGKQVAGEWIELVDDGAEHLAVFPPRSRNAAPHPEAQEVATMNRM